MKSKSSSERKNCSWDIDDDIMKEFNFDIGFEDDLLPMHSSPPGLSTIHADFFSSPIPRESMAAPLKKNVVCAVEDEMGMNFKDWSEERLDVRLSGGSELSYIFRSDEYRKKLALLETSGISSETSVSPGLVDLNHSNVGGWCGRKREDMKHFSDSSPLGLFNKQFSKSPVNQSHTPPSKNNLILTEDMLDKISANWFPADMILGDDFQPEVSPLK